MVSPSIPHCELPFIFLNMDSFLSREASKCGGELGERHERTHVRYQHFLAFLFRYPSREHQNKPPCLRSSVESITTFVAHMLALVFRGEMLDKATMTHLAWKSFRDQYLIPAFKILRRHGILAYANPRFHTRQSCLYYQRSEQTHFLEFGTMQLRHRFVNDSDMDLCMKILLMHIPFVAWDGDLTKAIRLGNGR